MLVHKGLRDVAYVQKIRFSSFIRWPAGLFPVPFRYVSQHKCTMLIRKAIQLFNFLVLFEISASVIGLPCGICHAAGVTTAAGSA